MKPLQWTTIQKEKGESQDREMQALLVRNLIRKLSAGTNYVDKSIKGKEGYQITVRTSLFMLQMLWWVWGKPLKADAGRKPAW